MIKKILIILFSIIAIAGSVAAFSAFEAHVINVTAHIENALKVLPPTGELVFGTVFPQEYQEKPIWITFSDSFCNPECGRVSTVDYKIVQKPKCWNGDVVNPLYEPVNYWDDECPMVDDVQYVKMPLLCSYLSKTKSKDETDIDHEVPAFHDPEDPLSIATGSINKYSDQIDKWIIDLAVPCFSGMCSQDWPQFVASHNPDADPKQYELDPALEGKEFGCDLWIEVTGIYNPPPACIPTTEVCDGVDNDCDGEVDEGCVITETLCNDGLDNDGDTLVDWQDSDCKIVINEVYYDEPGTDGPNVFIELFGPPNTPLNGLRIVGINGYNLPPVVYATIDLSGSTDANGYFLIAKPENILPPGLVDMTHSLADLQNGNGSGRAPDSVRLEYGTPSIILDTLGYGDPIGPAELYETIPAPDIAAGYSLSRNPSHTDTNNNFVDFHSCSPTPKTDDPICWTP